jgi:hypothetical protein
MDAQIECRDFQKPDDSLDFKTHGRIDVIKMRDGAAGMHAVLRPGWKWTLHEKPLLGNPDSCPMDHMGYCIAGELIVRMVATGQEVRVKAGDFFEIPKGHDAYVPGDQSCELILFQAAPHDGH